MKKNYFILILLFLAACSSKQRETIAHITERRVDAQGKLIISYRFNTGEKWISDSAKVVNRIIPHDSVKVLFSPEHPYQSRLLLP